MRRFEMIRAKEIFKNNSQNWKFYLLYDIGSFIICLGHKFYTLAQKFYKKPNNLDNRSLSN